MFRRSGIKLLRGSRRFGLGLAGAALFGLLLLTPSAHAADYQNGAYGRCAYSIGCSDSAVTTTETPDGLKVAVNLKNQQTIPAGSTYTITITPLNGRGQSFKQSDIYINGKLVATVLPDEDGTGRWPWDTKGYGSHPSIKVVITDQDGQVETQIFHIILRASTAGSAASHANAGGAAGGQMQPEVKGDSAVLQPLLVFNKSASKLIKRLPGGVVYTLPWLLLLLLLIEMIVLLLQAKREAREQYIAKELAAREREVSELKRGFVQLASHYLRTPLTIMRGGADLLAVGGGDAANGIKLAMSRLSDTVEGLINQISAGSAEATVSAEPSSDQSHKLTRVKHALAIWLPVLLVGFVIYDFLYIANHATHFRASTIAIITNMVIFSIGISVIYQLGRRWQLHRRDSQRTRQLLANEQAIQAEADQFISNSAQQLATVLAELEGLAAGLPDSATSKGAKFVREGLGQIKSTYQKLVVATHLRGSRTKDAWQRSSARTLYDQAGQSLAAQATAKQIAMTLDQDANLPLRSGNLLVLVLHSLLDNSLAYSDAGSRISVKAQVDESAASLAVTDSGRGIPQDKLDALAQPFFKAEGAEDFTHQGMGFSLYLDKLIMKYIDGSLAISSEPGKQTTVTATWNTKGFTGN